MTGILAAAESQFIITLLPSTLTTRSPLIHADLGPTCEAIPQVISLEDFLNNPCQLQQVLQTNPTTSARPISLFSPLPRERLKITSPHRIGETVSNLQRLYQVIQEDPEGLFWNTIAPQLLDHGRHEIQLDVLLKTGIYQLNPKNSRDRVEVKWPPWFHRPLIAKLTIDQGRLEGKVIFPQGVIMKKTLIPGFTGKVAMKQLQIVTDPATGETRFIVTATKLHIHGDATRELTRVLLERPMETIAGPASNFFRPFMKLINEVIERHPRQMAPSSGNEPKKRKILEQMLRAMTLRFRIDANQKPGTWKKLKKTSRVRLHFDRLEMAPGLILKGIDAHVEVKRIGKTQSFQVSVPRAEISEIKNKSGSYLRALRVEDMTLEMTLINPSDPLAGLYVQSGSGRLTFGGGNFSNDIIIEPIAADNAILFTVTGDRDGNLQVTVDSPEIGIEYADLLILGGEKFGGRTAGITAKRAVLRGLRLALGLSDSNISYLAEGTPSVEALTVSFLEPEGAPRAEIHLGPLQTDSREGKAPFHISGDKASATIRIASLEPFEVKSILKKDKTTYETSGPLKPTGNIEAKLDLTNPGSPTLNFTQSANPFQLSGPLKVTIKENAAETITSEDVAMIASILTP